MKKLNLPETEIRRLYWEEGLTARQVAAHFGASYGTIRYNMRKYQIKPRTSNEGRQLQSQKLVLKHQELLPKSKLREFYIGQNMTAQGIANLLGFSRSFVEKRLREYSLIRSKSEAISLDYAVGRRHSYFEGRRPWNWKGGRNVNGRGYIEIYYPEHPHATQRGYVLEHILVWEEAKSKLLPDGWVIHHLSGIRDDNRIENLVALPKRSHDMLLKEIRRRLRTVDEELRLLRHQRMLV